jgi:hypothetical protein
MYEKFICVVSVTSAKYTVLQGLRIGLDEMFVARRIERFLSAWLI